MMQQSRFFIRAAFIGINAASAITMATAQAEPMSAWRAFSGSGIAFVLPPTGSRPILLMASKGSKGPLISLLNLESALCVAHSGSSTALPPFSVNGTLLPFVEDCINGSTVERPATDQGEAFLRGAARSGEAITVDDGQGAVLHYPPADFAPVQQELQLRAYGF